MKSTLPALFRSQQTTNKSKHSNKKLSPTRQDPFYNLNLTIHHSYRTKIINSHHQRSIAEDKIPERSKIKFNERYASYPSRSLSVQK